MSGDIDELISASARGDIHRVTELIDNDPQLVSAMNMFGSSAIHTAHFSRHREIVSLLISRGQLLDEFLLAELGLADDLRQLLKEAPSLSRKVNSFGSTVLHGACYWGSVDSARLLLEYGADANCVTQDTSFRIHPLGCAVASPDVLNPSQDEDVVLSLVDLLLDWGADINARRYDGMTALHAAAYRGHLKVVRRMIERGADPTIRALIDPSAQDFGAHSGQLASDTASSQGQLETAHFLQSLQTRK